MPTITRWEGCYREGWQQGDIVPAAFGHPAKVAKSLAFRIIRHLITQGYVQAGALCVDPFAGIGGFALPAMSYGLRFLGVELEERFVALAQQNLALWQLRYGFTGGTVVQGDSRQLRRVLEGAEAACVVGSPPFCASLPKSAGIDTEERQRVALLLGKTMDEITPADLDSPAQQTYGTTPGQLGALPPGTPPVTGVTPPAAIVGSPPFLDERATSGRTYFEEGRPGRSITCFDDYGNSPGQLGSLPPGTPPAAPGTPPAALVSSPPYAGAGQVLGTHNGIDWSKAQDGGTAATPARVASGEGYGTSAGQLGNMAIVGSPPYADSMHQKDVEGIKRAMDTGKHTRASMGNPGPNSQLNQPRHYGHSAGQLGTMPAGLVSSPPWEDQLGNHDTAANYAALKAKMIRDGHSHAGLAGASFGADYGTAPEQLGNTTGTTFWSAADAVMREVSALLPVGGIACWVLKDYVSKGKRVPFCDQWRQLCESHGLVLIEEIHASLIEESGVQETLFGEAEKVQTERKSFFRRLHEKRPGAVRIDHETVLILVKEGETTQGKDTEASFPCMKPSLTQLIPAQQS